MKTYTLSADLECTGIHGTTGRDTEEGTLEAGALVRRAKKSTTGSIWSGVDSWTFEASTDGGATWYEQRSSEEPSLCAGSVNGCSCGWECCGAEDHALDLG